MTTKSKLSRLFIYITITFTLLTLTWWRIQTVKQSNQKQHISMHSEQTKAGIPVKTTTAKKSLFYQTTLLTVQKNGKNKLKGFITKDQQLLLQKDQPVYLNNINNVPDGHISFVATKPSLDNNLYALEILLQNNTKLPKSNFIKTKIVTKTSQHYNLPQQAVFYLNKTPYVWKIIKNTAHKQKITTGESNNTHTLILNGLTKGDFIVVTGMSKLKENSNVLILNQKNSR